MEDFRKLGASLNRSSSQPTVAPSCALNQFHRNSSGQMPQPYIAQEVCVIERTIRQEPVAALNSCNSGLTGLSPAKFRSELLAMVTSGKQQQQQHAVGLLPSYQPSVTSQSTYISSSAHPQLSLVNPAANPEGLVAWSAITPSSLYSASPLTGTRSSSAVTTTHASQCAQVRELSVTTSDRLVTGAANENVGFGGPGTDLLEKNLSFFNQSHEQQLGVRAASQQIQPAQWLTETVSRQQRIQSVVTSSSSPPMFFGSSTLKRNSQTSSNVLCGSPNHQPQAALNLAPMGQPLVFCAKFTGSHLSGELCLTGAGQLGVICSCHKVHMSVTKFTRHAGVYTGNPGEAVFMKGGLNLVQWRRLCFQQYGVKVPDDNVGWDWNDLDSSEIGRPNYTSVSTECSRKDSDACSGGKPLVATTSRTTEDWNASVAAAGNVSSMSHVSQTVFTSKHSTSQVSCGQGGVIHKQQETVSKYVGREFRGVNTCVEFESGRHSVTDPAGGPGLLRNQANNAAVGGLLQSFHNNASQASSQISSTTGYHNFINDGAGHRYLSSAPQQVSAAAAGVNNVKQQQLNYPPRNNWSDGKLDSQLKEKDSSSSSSFELRLGQPSQYTQPSGSSISSSVASASSVEHHQKSLFDEQVMHRVWDAKLQQNIQTFSASGFPKSSSNFGQRSEQQQHVLSKNQSGYEGEGRMQSTCIDGLVEQAQQSGIAASFSQSGRHLVNMPVMYPAGNMGASIRHPNPNPNCDQQMSKVTSRVINGQVRTDRSVMQCTVQTDQFRKCMMVMGNGKSLETQSSVALAHLNNRTENQLLETAIQASFKYRSIGLEFSSTTTNGKITSTGPSDGYMKSPFLSQAPSSNVSTQIDVKADTASSSDGVHYSGIARQVQQQDPTSALSLRDRQPLLVNEPSEQKMSLLTESSIMNEELRGRKLVQIHHADGMLQSEDKSWVAVKGREIQEQPQVLLTNKVQDRMPGLPAVKLESDLNAKSPKLASLHNSGLSDGKGARHNFKASPAADHDPQTQHAETAHVVEHTVGEGSKKALSEGDDPSSMTKVKDIQCHCFKCRKSCPSTRGQAVARIAGQVCLKEKGCQGTNTERADKNIEIDRGQIGSSSSEKVEQSETLEHRTAVVPAKPGNGETSRDDNSHGEQQPLLSKMVKRTTIEEEVSDDVLSDTGAQGGCTLEGVGKISVNIRDPNHELSEACSKSSEHVRSGLSDEKEGQGNDEQEEEEDMALQGQSSGSELHCVPNGVVHDEASEIGKSCSSSDGAAAATNLNPVSAAADLTKPESPTPSSTGCPFSSNVAEEKLMIDTDAQQTGRGGGGEGGQQSTTEAEEDHENSETERVEQKQQMNLKWTQLDSNGAVGDVKNRKSVDSGEYTAEQIQQQAAQKIVDVGNPNQRSEALLPEAVGEKGEGERSQSIGGKEKILKWRRVPVGDLSPSFVSNCSPSCVSVVEMKGTEEEETFRNAEGDGPTLRRKNRTLVIRVPQGIFREKAKGAMQSRHGLSKTPTNGSPAADASNHCPSSIVEKENLGEGSAVRNGSNEKGSSLKKRRSESPIAVTTPPVAQNLMMKKFRSIRRPVARSNPQSGRMVSLSNILKHRAERIDPQYRAVSKQITAAKAEGFHKRIESDSCAVATSPMDSKKTTELFSRTEQAPPPPQLESSTVGVLQKDEAQKVRSLFELTGKKKPTGTVTEGFAIAENSVDLSGKFNMASAQTKSSPQLCPFSESPCAVPRRGRSVRSNGLRRRNAQWHTTKDAQPADVVGKSNATLEDKKRSSPSSQAKVNCHEEKDVTSVSQTQKTHSEVKYQNNFCEQETYEIVPLRKKPRSSKVGAKAMHNRDVPAVAQDVKVVQVATAHVDVRAAANEVKPNHVPSDFKSSLKRRVYIPSKTLDSSGKRLKLADGSTEAKHVEDKMLQSSMLGTSSCKERVKKRTVVASTPITKTRTEIEGSKQSVGGHQQEDKIFPSKNCKGVIHTSDYCRNTKKYASCDVCRMSSSKICNKLLSCGRCPVKVHQACYGVPKIPKGAWFCRTCKLNVVNPVCILCGYGGGPMTCVQKTRGFVEGLLQAWRDLESSTEGGGPLESPASVKVGNSSCEFCGNRKSKKNQGSFCKACKRVYAVNGLNPITQRDALSSCNPHGKSSSHDIWLSENTVTATAARDSAVKQWAHMVCTLWMPGTRCLNFETMGVFDVSGVTSSNRKVVCSICKRKGGACIKCRLPSCSIPFHVWCAHGKGLLQSEAAEDGSDQVGFFGKCLKHGS